MSSTIPRSGRASAGRGNDVESLYAAFLKCFYDDGDREKAQRIAPRLEKALAKSPDAAGSIRGEEIRSLIAELRGNLAEAARSREAEIRKILELHSLAVNTPAWTRVARTYDFSDVSDRLDLLAVLYDKQGDTDRAIATLLESKHYCESHHVPFDGQDLLEELEGSRKPSASGNHRRAD
jgi:hypothetical protein